MPPRLLVSLALLPALAGCSTRVPIVMSGSTVGRSEGVAIATLYTGTLQAGACRGSFTGPIDAGEAPLIVSCDGGRQGRGVAVLEGGRFVSGRVTWTDGSTASITLAPPVPAAPTPGDARTRRP